MRDIIVGEGLVPSRAGDHEGLPYIREWQDVCPTMSLVGAGLAPPKNGVWKRER